MEPVAKGRPRVVTKGGKTFAYTPGKTVHAENMIRYALKDKGCFDAGMPLRLEAIFYRIRPKSSSKKVKLPVTSPDLDNYIKLITDALEKFAYANDSQITTMLVRKRFGNPPRIEIKLEEDMEPPDWF